jgi:hypothetical protein
MVAYKKIENMTIIISQIKEFSGIGVTIQHTNAAKEPWGWDKKPPHEGGGRVSKASMVIWEILLPVLYQSPA